MTAAHPIPKSGESPNSTKTPVVLFLCGANRARSQMAEALLAHDTDGRFQARSAGLRPATAIDPMAIEVLEEIGIDTSRLRPKPVDEFMRDRIDCAIIVCEKAEEYCPRLYPFCYRVLHWPFEDPVAFEGSDEDRLEAFRRLRDDLQGRIRQWIDEKPFGEIH
jgi:arsenate reductase